MAEEQWKPQIELGIFLNSRTTQCKKKSIGG